MDELKNKTLADHADSETEFREESPAYSSPSDTGAENFWGSDADIEIPAAASPAQKEEAAPAAPEAVAVKTTQVVTDSTAELSAKNAVGMMDFTNRLLLTPIANWKIKKAMKKINPDLEELETIVDSSDAELKEAGLKEKRAFERLMKKATKLLDAIPMTPEEKADAKDTFKTYMVHTQKQLPPAMGVYFMIANTTGKRVIDLVFD